MLEYSNNQAAGLVALSAQRSPRLLAAVSHGDGQAELPLLWRLCLALMEFGYSVTVLDASTRECADNPGLLQLLDSDYWQGTRSLDAPAWNVVPSALGMQWLCNQACQGPPDLARLGQLFAQDSVVVVYGNAECLTTLLGNTETEPLLTVSDKADCLMTSYLALKRLLLMGKLVPTIVDLSQDRHAVALGLGECAKRFLDYDVRPIHISALNDENAQHAEVQHLALRWLEGAVALDTRSRHAARDTSPPEFARSH
ncbi:MAG: hypothetical protein ACR2I0_05040 [Rhodoferax sp.]